MQEHDRELAAALDADGVIEEFEAVWLAQARDVGIPSAQRINPGEIARLMPHVMLLEVEPEGNNTHFRTRLVGARHRSLMQDLKPGDLLDDCDGPHTERLRIAAATGKPVYWRDDSEFSVAIGDFPFAADGQTVDRIVSVVVGGPEKRRFFFG